MAKEMVSVILPAYNEEERLKENVNRLETVLAGTLDRFEIIISEDGSSDGTVTVAKSMESVRVRIFHGGKRLGKGAAIKNAARYAKGNIIMFMDADLASNPAHVEELVRVIRDGAAIVIGSRYLKESKAKRSMMRYVASRGFNWLVRTVLGSRLTDHQCGFKAFRKDLVLPVISEVETSGWFWDTELLVRAQRKGLSIAEIPIEWKEIPGSKFRLLSDAYYMACSLLSFKLKHG
ncbi:glycosyltransferase family 2 protein [Candidatus Micrarchaeota archaeon]|nr:glycosyltransferase family 2 protein [Candidatus Micrarchaeota archaeon]